MLTASNFEIKILGLFLIILTVCLLTLQVVVILSEPLILQHEGKYNKL